MAPAVRSVAWSTPHFNDAGLISGTNGRPATRLNASAMASIRFACELDPDTIQVSLATPYPGTEFYDFCREQGFLQDDTLVNGATGFQQCVVDYPGLAAADIFQALPRFYRRFYFRPRYMARAALVMMRDPVERRRLLKEGRQFLSFMFKRRQAQKTMVSEANRCP